MAKSTPLFVGLDVHKESIAVAHAAGGSTEPPVFAARVTGKDAKLRLKAFLLRLGRHYVGRAT